MRAGRRVAHAVAVLALMLCLLAWPIAGRSQDRPASGAVGWPEADRLFHSDPRWLGGDAAFSVDLGGGRVLWFFGDSFAATRPGATRRQAAFVRNSVAIQFGYDPAQATIRFYTGHHRGRLADYLAAPEPNQWLWPLHGIRLGDRLLLFTMRQTRDPKPGALGFQSIGSRAFLVDRPDADPSQWKPRPVPTPESDGKMLVGMALVREAGFLYAYVLNDADHMAFLLRWSEAEAAGGRLLQPYWWCGAGGGWQTSPKLRQPVIRDAGGEFSVQRDPRGTGFLEVNSAGFGATSIVLRRAARPEGPWSEPQTLYWPPESAEPGLLVYAAKSHPELAGGDLVVTYAANGPDERLATDMNLYFPRFVRVSLSEQAHTAFAHP